MQDVKLIQDENGLFDLVVEDEQYASVDGFQTSIEVSLFTDSRAPASLVPEAMRRRGWVGNIITAVEEREIGGLLWLLDQARATTGTVQQAEIYANGALMHFVEDDIVNQVILNVERTQRQITIGIEFRIEDNLTERYNILWRNTNAAGI